MNSYLRRAMSEELASSTIPTVLRKLAEVAYERADGLDSTKRSESERLARHAKRVEMLAREMEEGR